MAGAQPRVSLTRTFWAEENLKYSTPNFRARKCARLIGKMAGEVSWDLLDIGCGPATLQTLLPPNIKYHGIDMAIHDPAPCLLEVDLSKAPIKFHSKRFDVVVALGFFEYMNGHECQKLREIAAILKPGGVFVMSYINFAHYRAKIWPAYNNVHSIEEMTRALSDHFSVERYFPASHHWRHKQPGRHALQRLQLRLTREIPVVSHRLAVEYFFVCRHHAGTRHPMGVRRRS
jgi:cyclopropane fatty-acyl-phospholipid synthase-like methyltransferase